MATTAVAIGTMKVAQVPSPGADFKIVEREIPEPDAGQVRIKVQACGVCHSDVLTKEGAWPGIQYPRVPGHEVAGRIDAVGENVTMWSNGQRVGVGWHGGHCFVCEQCRRGDFAMCINRKVTGFDFDGGYAEYMIAPAPSEPLSINVFSLILRRSSVAVGTRARREIHRTHSNSVRRKTCIP